MSVAITPIAIPIIAPRERPEEGGVTEWERHEVPERVVFGLHSQEERKSPVVCGEELGRSQSGRDRGN
jgi:hypothetical protein